MTRSGPVIPVQYALANARIRPFSTVSSVISLNVSSVSTSRNSTAYGFHLASPASRRPSVAALKPGATVVPVAEPVTRVRSASRAAIAVANRCRPGTGAGSPAGSYPCSGRAATPAKFRSAPIRPGGTAASAVVSLATSTRQVGTLAASTVLHTGSGNSVPTVQCRCTSASDSTAAVPKFISVATRYSAAPSRSVSAGGTTAHGVPVTLPRTSSCTCRATPRRVAPSPTSRYSRVSARRAAGAGETVAVNVVGCNGSGTTHCHATLVSAGPRISSPVPVARPGSTLAEVAIASPSRSSRTRWQGVQVVDRGLVRVGVQVLAAGRRDAHHQAHVPLGAADHGPDEQPEPAGLDHLHGRVDRHPPGGDVRVGAAQRLDGVQVAPPAGAGHAYRHAAVRRLVDQHHPQVPVLHRHRLAGLRGRRVGGDVLRGPRLPRLPPGEPGPHAVDAAGHRHRQRRRVAQHRVEAERRGELAQRALGPFPRHLQALLR